MSEEKEKRLAEEIDYLRRELSRVKTRDELTGLYNRNTFFGKIRETFDENPDEKYAVICLDIEKFKFINDRFGFVEGDRLLTYIGEKLDEKTEQCNSVACRLSADVFSFLSKEKDINPDALGAEIQSWVKDYPLDVDIKISAGIYHVESRNIPVRLMCDRANFAIENIKGNYMVNVAEYNKDVRDHMFSQNEMLNDAESAFANRDFKVYLQPKFDIRTNKVIGAESLVRWQHPQKGLIMPKDFIPLFEHNMLVTRLDEYIWEETCRLIRGWIDCGYSTVPVSVNVSRMDIYVLDITNKFVEFTDRYNIDRRLIEIEITESAFSNDEEQIISVVDKLRRLGFKVLMDDFGSGYSSLNILKDINVDVLKIDTRFLEPGKGDNKKGKEILESVIRMAKWIGLQTIAEGVETDDQKRFLLNLGCYYAQGFYFAKPMPEAEFVKLIQNPENVMSDSFSGETIGKIDIDELFHSDFMTESLLNNILGGVAIYKFDGKDDFRIIKANEAYYDIKNYVSLIDLSSQNILDSSAPEDRERIIKALVEAKKSGSKGAMIHLRNIRRNKNEWITVRMFYLADREDYELYYSSVSDSTELMNAMQERDMARRSFETALELVEVFVLEYNFADRTLRVKTKPSDNENYLLGDYIENAPEAFIKHNIIHRNSIPTMEKICAHLKNSDEPISEMIDLCQYGNVYKRCLFKAKTVFDDKTPVKAILVIKSTGQIVE
ncbi:MAG: EAL domain-containing protein [Hominilimicola sp.]